MVPKEILVTYISEMIFTFYTIRGSRKRFLHINHNNKRDKSVFISHEISFKGIVLTYISPIVHNRSKLNFYDGREILPTDIRAMLFSKQLH